jgi:hypothetical protein
MPIASHDETVRLVKYSRVFWEPMGKYIFQFGYLEKDLDWC